jgi:luciferase family oxidoreductase group 1
MPLARAAGFGIVTAMIPFSVLDLAPIVAGSDAGQALRNTRELAAHAERLGFLRYWLAEHHNMTGIASAATSVVIGYVAEATTTIRVGSGGIMLPNHAPLVIAEHFGTLAALYPGRIDLGIGRAPGTDQRTSQALRRNLHGNVDRFPEDVIELQRYFEAAQPGQAVQAVPGAGLQVPIWILGSSLYGAQLAAALGLPFAFASHFAPDQLGQALELYRLRFRPSAGLLRPHVMLAINAIAADTEPEARRLFTSLEQAFVNLRRGQPGPLPAPVSSMEGRISAMERAGLDAALACSVVGSPETIKAGLARFIARTRPDELMVTGHIHDHAARLRSFELVANARRELAR